MEGPRSPRGWQRRRSAGGGGPPARGGGGTAPRLLEDAGIENKNRSIDELIATGLFQRVIAMTEIRFSNSMIEAWWRSRKHNWLFLHPLDTTATVRREVAFSVERHNGVIPHRALEGQTPDEIHFGERG